MRTRFPRFPPEHPRERRRKLLNAVGDCIQPEFRVPDRRRGRGLPVARVFCEGSDWMQTHDHGQRAAAPLRAIARRLLADTCKRAACRRLIVPLGRGIAVVMSFSKLGPVTYGPFPGTTQEAPLTQSWRTAEI